VNRRSSRSQASYTPLRKRIRPIRTFGLGIAWVALIGILFLFYQLWGTGFYESQSQDDLALQFENLLIAQPVIALPTTTTTTSVPAPTGTTPIESTPTNAFSPPDAQTLEQIRRVVNAQDGDVIARMLVPAIDLDKYVVEGVGVSDLRKGIGRYRGSAHIGDLGNAALAGHRSTYGEPFGRIGELLPGDQISLVTPIGTAIYEVMDPNDYVATWASKVRSVGIGHVIVGPADEFVIGDVGDNRLTLTACHPRFSAEERLIVVARLVDGRLPLLDPMYGIPPAVQQPAPEPEPLLEGQTPPETTTTTTTIPPPLVERDPPKAVESLQVSMTGLPTELAPSFVLALLLLVVMTAVAVVANKIGRATAILLGIAPFLFVLWQFFTHLELVLPAY
jgi:sortase A